MITNETKSRAAESSSLQEGQLPETAKVKLKFQCWHQVWRYRNVIGCSQEKMYAFRGSGDMERSHMHRQQHWESGSLTPGAQMMPSSVLDVEYWAVGFGIPFLFCYYWGWSSLLCPCPSLFWSMTVLCRCMLKVHYLFCDLIGTHIYEITWKLRRDFKLMNNVESIRWWDYWN